MTLEAPDPGLAKQCFLALLANPNTVVANCDQLRLVAKDAFYAAQVWVAVAKEMKDKQFD